MDEHSYIRSVHRLIPKPTLSWKINDNYAGGVADVYYDDVGNMLFAEYKYVGIIPKRPLTLLKPNCSSLQLMWLKERYERSRPTVVVMGTKVGGIIFTQLSWEVGITSQNLCLYALPPGKVAGIISEHCQGGVHVNNHEQTYPNCKRSQKSPNAKDVVGSA